jgi:RNA polymerase sigma-70 factor (ECF subfamily)
LQILNGCFVTLKQHTEHIDFEKAYIAHFAKMKRFAKEYVLSSEEAENIVQGVFLELWEKREMLSMPVNLVAFLFTAVKNRCLDYLRHQVVVKETKNKLQEEQEITLKMKFNSLEVFDQSIFSEKDIEATLSKAIATLPEKCREIFIKSRIKGEKQKDIAKELNISIHTVETQMNIAYKKLRTELKDYIPLLLFLL